MRKSLVRTALAVALTCAAVGHAQTTTGKKTAAPQRPKETFWEWVLRFSGISATPNTLKGADDEMLAGQVWVADLTSGERRKITSDGGYRSPLYFPDGNDILAVQGTYAVRIFSGGKKPAKLFVIAGVTKLVGFSLDNPDEVLILKEDDAGHTLPARLSVGSGGITPLPYDPQSSRDRQMLEHLQDWQRSYGDVTLYVKRESKEALSGTKDVSNVFLKAPGRDPQNVSGCDMGNCGQPSLSPDGKRVLFIKAGA